MTQAKLERDIKKLAAQNEMSAVRVMAKDLVRTRQYISRFHVMHSNLQSLSLKMQSMKTSHEMGVAMGKMTKAMKRMNKKMNAQTISKIVRQFEMENEKSDFTEEMMSDAIGDAFDDGETEEEEDAIVNQVLDEIGVSLTGNLAAAPSAPVHEAAQHAPAQPVAAAEGGGGGGAPAEDDAAVDDLEARLNNLRRGN